MAEPSDPSTRPDSRFTAALTPGGPVDHRPGEAILTTGGDDDTSGLIEAVGKLAGTEIQVDDADLTQARRSGYLRIRFDPAVDVIALVRRVNTELGDGTLAPNTVLRIGSFVADPMRFASGFMADPMRFASLYGADPMRFANLSTARPVVSASDPYPRLTKGPGAAVVAILDTGVPIVGAPQPSDVDFVGLGAGVRDSPDLDADAYLDIAAGHSTFIRTIIQRASPAAEIMVEGVIHNDGDGDEVDVADALMRVHDAVKDKRRLLVNLSFSGYYLDDLEPPMIAFWVRELVRGGAVVVAAAGNDGACRRKYPAAMAEVLSVGSVGSCGPSPFSNHGHWVDASAPGEDLVSEFFDHFDGAVEPLVPGSVPDIDDFDGWAMWSGTSFSTPAIVGALAEIIETHDCPARVALAKLINRPGLFRLPDYGVIVNRIF
jgi:Subtilase family